MRQVLVVVLCMVAVALASMAIAGTLTVNGNACGELVSITYKPAGNLDAITSGSCGAVQPPPPVEPPPSACNGCVDKPWPNIPQAQYQIRDGETHVYRVTTGATVGTGRVVTNITTGETSSRQLAISKAPGGFAPGSARCVTTGGEQASIGWTGAASTLRCVMEPNTIYYINIRATNCPADTKCGYYMSASGT